MANILCVEDAEDTIILLSQVLDGHQITFARTVQDALKCVSKELFSLFLVDIELPDGTGLEFTAGLPEAAKSRPVLFLTGKQDFASKVSAFSLGADDFIQKPFDPRELRLRVDSRLKKLSVSDRGSSAFAIGDLVCSPEEQRLKMKTTGSTIDLTSLEFRLFFLLAKTQNKIFTREEILNRIWTNNTTVTDRTVDVHISNLRRKLTGSKVTIETVIGTGYRVAVSSDSTHPSEIQM